MKLYIRPVLSACLVIYTAHARVPVRLRAQELVPGRTRPVLVQAGASVGIDHGPVAGDLEAALPPTIEQDSVEGDRAEYSVHSLAGQLVMPASCVFLLCLLFAGITARSRHTRFLPESAATVMCSVLLGVIVRQLLASGFIQLEGFTLGSATFLNLVMLPVIIFNSGWSLRSGDFLSQFEYILIFAVFGTMISTLVIGFASQAIALHLGWHPVVSLRENLIFAALISAVDPVATLATYNSLGVPRKQPLLNIMVFGESVINDAVAIVLFSVLNTTALEQLDNWDNVVEIMRLLFGSIVFGLCVSCLLVLAMRLALLPGHTLSEILYIWGCAYFIYALAEVNHFSGIIANLFAGIVFRQYGSQHLNEHGKRMVTEFLEISAHLMDTSVFVLCGTSTALIKSMRGLKFGALGVLLCFFARAASVSTCAFASNRLKEMQGEPNIITAKHQFMMWHGGLRGGIALILALEIDATWCRHKATIINGTFVVICVLLLVLGGTTELMLQRLGLVSDDDGPETEASALLSLALQKSESRQLCLKFFQACDGVLQEALVGNLDVNEEKRRKRMHHAE